MRRQVRHVATTLPNMSLGSMAFYHSNASFARLGHKKSPAVTPGFF
jgi:hypothetical protein